MIDSEAGKKGFIFLNEEDPAIFKMFSDWLYNGMIVWLREAQYWQIQEDKSLQPQPKSPLGLCRAQPKFRDSKLAFAKDSTTTFKNYLAYTVLQRSILSTTWWIGASTRSKTGSTNMPPCSALAFLWKYSRKRKNQASFENSASLPTYFTPTVDAANFERRIWWRPSWILITWLISLSESHAISPSLGGESVKGSTTSIRLRDSASLIALSYAHVTSMSITLIKPMRAMRAVLLDSLSVTTTMMILWPSSGCCAGSRNTLSMASNLWRDVLLWWTVMMRRMLFALTQ